MGHALFALIGILAGAVPALAGDTTYRDPRQPSFTLLVPDEWTALRNDKGVMLKRGDSYFQLGVLGEAISPGAMLVL